MILRYGCVSATVCLVLLGVRGAWAAPPSAWDHLHRLDLLPQFRESVSLGAVTSYDRDGGNDDGFSGKYSFVAKEGDDLVIADLQGPGVIYRIWTPTPTDDLLEFYFDGEREPRIRVKFRDLFTGAVPPFVTPLVGSGAGGFYSYLPIPYEQSCKIVVRAPRLQFYQINYARYAADAGVRTWSPEMNEADRAAQACVQAVFAASGSDVSSYVSPPDNERTTHEQSCSVPPGGTATLFETQQGGRIVGLRIAPASALAGKDRGLILRMTWDGDPRPAVECPAGDFFGFAWGRPAMKSLLFGTADDTCYCYFPMPYNRSAKIELVSQRTAGPPVELRTEVVTVAPARRENEGSFHALWRRENPTTPGTPFTFVATEGRGHLVACILQAQGMVSGNTYFFEGDDQTTLDGTLVIHGTGSEDFFNGGWYDVPDRWEKQISFPLSGCLGYQKHLGRTGGYRLLLGDAYAFDKSILQTIEHAPTNNDLATDYVGVTFLYLQDAPSCDTSLPPLAKRAVVDFTQLTFTPAWAVPITAFTFRGATLTKMDEELSGQRSSFLRMQASSPTDWFGVPFIALECEFPTAGRYRITIDALQGPEQACVQLFRNELPAGEPVDLFATQRSRRDGVLLGEVQVEEGASSLMFKLVDQNTAATGRGLDLANIHCEKIE